MGHIQSICIKILSKPRVSFFELCWKFDENATTTDSRSTLPPPQKAHDIEYKVECRLLVRKKYEQADSGISFYFNIFEIFFKWGNIDL